jgi:hypothetical protein
MFGDLMRWNPAEELSTWQRDIDELFSRSMTFRYRRKEIS